MQGAFGRDRPGPGEGYQQYVQLLRGHRDKEAGRRGDVLLLGLRDGAGGKDQYGPEREKTRDRAGGRNAKRGMAQAIIGHKDSTSDRSCDEQDLTGRTEEHVHDRAGSLPAIEKTRRH